jgi:hypothetical protein
VMLLAHLSLIANLIVHSSALSSVLSGVLIVQERSKFAYFPTIISEMGPLYNSLKFVGNIVSLDNDSCERRMTSDLLYSSIRSNGHLITLIPRGNCSFIQKVRNAQEAGSDAVIIYNSGDEVKWLQEGSHENITERKSDYPRQKSEFKGLIQMKSISSDKHVMIPSTFISFESGMMIKNILKKRKKIKAYIYTIDNIYKARESLNVLIIPSNL